MGEKQTDIMAILGLVFAFIMPIVGIILSAISLKKVKSGEFSENSKSLAIAGLVISIVEMVLVVVMFIIFFATAATVTSGIVSGMTTIS